VKVLVLAKLFKSTLNLDFSPLFDGLRRIIGFLGCLYCGLCGIGFQQLRNRYVYPTKCDSEEIQFSRSQITLTIMMGCGPNHFQCTNPVSISDLNKQIQRQLGIESHLFRLTYNSKQLDSSQKIHFDDGAVIHMSMRLMGGGRKRSRSDAADGSTSVATDRISICQFAHKIVAEGCGCKI
jgi:hypothetical protein